MPANNPAVSGRSGVLDEAKHMDQILRDILGDNYTEDEEIYDSIGEEDEKPVDNTPLLSYVPSEKFKELGFGGFIKELATKIGGWDKPVKIGLEHSSVTIIPRAVDSMSGKTITPRDTFGQRLYELIQTISIPPDKQVDEDGIILPDYERKVRTEVNRTRGALLMFGRTSIAKKLTKSGRDCLMLCSRTDELIGYHDVLINPADAQGTRIKQDEVCLVGRFPGSIFGTHRIILTADVPPGTCWTSCKFTISNGGDYDGDQALIVPTNKC